MELSFLEILPNLGVGVTAVVVLYMAFSMFVKAMNSREKAFREYVQTNNHRVTELVVEATQAIKESTTVIKESSKAIQISTETIKDIRNFIWNENKSNK